jgi:teichuronic acid exporter
MNLTKPLIIKLFEKASVKLITLLVNIVIARLVMPEVYGILSIVLIFNSLSRVIVDCGLSIGLMQKSIIDEDDYSTVMWITITISVILYTVLYMVGPAIASIYGHEEIVGGLRVLAISLVFSSISSVQNAKLLRNMKFAITARCNLISTILSGAVAIALAYLGFELWALVLQQLLNSIFISIMMVYSTRWIPRLRIKFDRLRSLFSYSGKLMVANVVDAVYNDLIGLMIGKVYSAEALGYYNNGKQFPNIISSTMSDAVSSIIIPIFSRRKDNLGEIKESTKQLNQMIYLVISPLLLFCCIAARDLVMVVLTEKWLGIVNYIAVFCLIYLQYPICINNLQMYNSLGESKVYMWTVLANKAISTSAILIAVLFTRSPMGIVVALFVSTPINTYIDLYHARRAINYPVHRQLLDIAKYVAFSLISCLPVLIIDQFVSSHFISLILSVVTSSGIYISLLLITKDQYVSKVIKMLKKTGGNKA